MKKGKIVLVNNELVTLVDDSKKKAIEMIKILYKSFYELVYIKDDIIKRLNKIEIRIVYDYSDYYGYLPFENKILLDGVTLGSLYEKYQLEELSKKELENILIEELIGLYLESLHYIICKSNTSNNKYEILYSKYGMYIDSNREYGNQVLSKIKSNNVLSFIIYNHENNCFIVKQIEENDYSLGDEFKICDDDEIISSLNNDEFVCTTNETFDALIISCFSNALLNSNATSIYYLQDYINSQIENGENDIYLNLGYNIFARMEYDDIKWYLSSHISDYKYDKFRDIYGENYDIIVELLNYLTSIKVDINNLSKNYLRKYKRCIKLINK